MSGQLHQPLYRLLELHLTGGEVFKFDGALMVVLDEYSMHIFNIDARRPLLGPIKQSQYTKRFVRIDKIVYSISLSTAGDEAVDLGDGESAPAGDSDHYSEVFCHKFIEPAGMEHSVIASPNHKPLLECYKASQVFPNISGVGSFPVMQFVH